MPGEIVLGFDSTAESRAAVVVAADLAATYDTTLVIVFGYEPPRFGGEVGALRDEIEKVGEELGADALAEVRELAPDVDARVELVQGRPIESIVEIADDVDARFIVVGHRQRSLIAEMFSGSVLEGVMTATTRPVVAVQVPEDA